jgi:AraC-like DNA-binding protein
MEATHLGADYLSKSTIDGGTLIARVRDAITPGSRESEAGAIAVLRNVSLSVVKANGEPEWRLMQRQLIEAAIQEGMSSAAFMALVEGSREISVNADRPDLLIRLLYRLASRLRESARRSISVPRLSVKADQSPAPRSCGRSRIARMAKTMRLAAVELALSHEQVAQIAYGLGYEHHSAFDRDFRDTFGMSPKSLRCLLQR